MQPGQSLAALCCCSPGLPAAFLSLRLVLCQPPGSAAPRSPRPGPTAAASFSSSASSSSSAPGCSAQSPRQRRPAPLPPRRQLARPARPGAQPGPRPPQSPPRGYLPPPWGGSACRPRGRAGMPVSAGGWGRLGRLGRGVCPPVLGLERCGPRQSDPPPPPRWAPNFVLRGALYTGRSRQFWGGGCFGSCFYPDQEEEGAVTFSDCGQGTAAASLGGSGDVRCRWRGKLPLKMPSPGLRGAGEL